MAIDKTIYNNGVKGMLSYWEIDALPRDYEVFKSMFREATEMKEGKRAFFSQNNLTIYYDPAHNKPMSRFKKELRAMQVISRATYGMKNTKFLEKETIYGDKRDIANIVKSFIAKVKFWCNPVRLWRMFSLYWNLRKKWSDDDKKYRKAKKELKKAMKEKYNKNKSIRYNVDTNEWRPFGTC